MKTNARFITMFLLVFSSSSFADKTTLLPIQIVEPELPQAPLVPVPPGPNVIPPPLPPLVEGCFTSDSNPDTSCHGQTPGAVCGENKVCVAGEEALRWMTPVAEYVMYECTCMDSVGN